MAKLKILTDTAFKNKLKSYPNPVKKKIANLRALVLEVADKSESITEIQETLKWGEPSFLVKGGSTIRMDWKPKKNPDQYALYFKCTSKLVATFKEVYGDGFKYEKTRALLFNMDEVVPEKKVKKCIEAALLYHSVKGEKFLGLNE